MNSSSANAITLTKFDFDAEYDFGEQEDDIKSITPRTFKESTQASFDDGYQAGYAEGFKEANDSINRIIGEQFQALSYVEKTLSDFHQELAAVVHAIALKLFPVMMKAGAQDELNHLFENILATLDKTLHIEVTVNPLCADASRERLEELKVTYNFHGTIKVCGDDALSSGDCRIEWHGGGIHQYLETSLREIEKMLEKFSGFKPTPSTQTETNAQTQDSTPPEVSEATVNQDTQTTENKGDGA